MSGNRNQVKTFTIEYSYQMQRLVHRSLAIHLLQLLWDSSSEGVALRPATLQVEGNRKPPEIPAEP